MAKKRFDIKIFDLNNFPQVIIFESILATFEVSIVCKYFVLVIYTYLLDLNTPPEALCILYCFY